MRRPLILILLACGLPALSYTPARAQADDPLNEARGLNSQCVEFYKAGKYDEAIDACQRALAIREKTLGSERPGLAAVLGNLASALTAKGEYAQAEPLLRRALAIDEKALGTDHPDLAIDLNNLAQLYYAKADYAQAEPLLQRSLSIREKAFDSESLIIATSLNNLAEVYKAEGKFAPAEPLLERALAIFEKALGHEHPSVATLLNNLALLYEDRGDYVKAEPLLQRALAIGEKTLGSEHPGLAGNLNNLAGLYQYQGAYAKAEPLLRRALAIYEKALGGEHTLVATALSNLAAVYEAEGDYPRAVEFERRSAEVRESNVNAILATGSEKQKQLYLNRLSAGAEAIVSLHVHSAPADAQAARLALTTILRRKGRSLDAMTDQIAALRRRAAPGDVKLLDALAAAESQLANLQLSSDARLSPTERRARVAALETEIEKLQDNISRRSAEFRARTQPVTLDAVRAAIPADAALIEIFAYHPYNAKSKSIDENFGKERYVAYILKPQDETPQFVDLGEAAPINADLALWREALLDPDRADVRALGRRVDERVMRPVRKLLGTTKRLFISPDGALNLIPFAALVDENNQYLMETYSLDYLTSGRDLLRPLVRSENRPETVIFANPTYNLTGRHIAACDPQRKGRALLLSAGTASSTSETDATSRATIAFRDIDFTQVCYPPLRGTAQEAMRINRVLPNATVLTDKSATEAALKALNAPSILHIATHGYFFEDQPQVLNKDGAQSANASNNENPLLRSGLIMAGANQKASGPGEDGVLTAAEAAGLNLWGTKLVVLSACETGLGDVVNGAGVYGLRRALVLAGSETQVMSLWQVDDAATRDLMSDYYTRLQHGEGRTEAMRRAQLAMLRGETRLASAPGTRTPPIAGSAHHAHPFYWAAFISSGDWRAMNGKEQ